MTALSTYFPSAKGHLCLEHAKQNTEKRFSGGFKKLTKNFTEFSAFITLPVFYIATNQFLASLSEQGQDITYLTTARKGGAFVATNDVWGAPWRSSFRECVPGSSTFVPQVVEADWKSEDILHGPMKSATTDRVIANCQRRMKLRFNDETFNFIYHKPSGPHLHQGSFIRG